MYNESSKKASMKYKSEKRERIIVELPKGEKDLIQAHAEAHGESTNGFINRAISETMERDKADGE